MKRIALLVVYTTLIFVGLVGNASAHGARENYVWINIETDHISGRFELNTDDLKNKLGIVIDAEAASREKDLQESAQQVTDYLKENFSISDQEGPFDLTMTELGFSTEAPKFTQYHFKTQRLPASDTLNIQNTILMTPELAKSDPLHRSLIVLEYNKAANLNFGTDTPYLVFGPSKTMAELNIIEPTGILAWQDFFLQGILHIWKGTDHILFVVVLLLTTVLIVSSKRWVPIEKFRGAFFNTLKIITLFTIAHSITLGLAAFGYVSLNSSLIESIIALSIIAMAINNIIPRFNSQAWLLVFIFGLFHGLGFASVMSELQFRTDKMWEILLMFNLGVEVGQLAIVIIVFPILFWLRRYAFYHPFIVVPISLLSIIVAAYWLFERTGMSAYVT